MTSLTSPCTWNTPSYSVNASPVSQSKPKAHIDLETVRFISQSTNSATDLSFNDYSARDTNSSHVQIVHPQPQNSLKSRQKISIKRTAPTALPTGPCDYSGPIERIFEVEKVREPIQRKRERKVLQKGPDAKNIINNTSTEPSPQFEECCLVIEPYSKVRSAKAKSDRRLRNLMREFAPVMRMRLLVAGLSLSQSSQTLHLINHTEISLKYDKILSKLEAQPHASPKLLAALRLPQQAGLRAFIAENLCMISELAANRPLIEKELEAAQC